MFYKNRFIFVFGVCGLLSASPVFAGSTPVGVGGVSESEMDKAIGANQDVIDSAFFDMDDFDASVESAQFGALDSLEDGVGDAADDILDDLTFQIDQQMAHNEQLFGAGGGENSLTDEQKQSLKEKVGVDKKPIAGTTINSIGYIAFSTRVDALQTEQAKTIRKILGLPTKQQKSDKSNTPKKKDADNHMSGALEKVDSVDELAIIDSGWGSN